MVCPNALALPTLIINNLYKNIYFYSYVIFVNLLRSS